MTDTLPRYRERLSPSLPFFVALCLTGPMVALSFIPVGSVIALVSGVLATVGLITLAVLLSPRVVVEGTTLRAGRAHIDARWLGEPAQFTGAEARAMRGSQLDRAGWHLIRGGVDGVIVIPITDPADPVRTWTVSTRTPDRLAAAIQRARRTATGE